MRSAQRPPFWALVFLLIVGGIGFISDLGGAAQTLGSTLDSLRVALPSPLAQLTDETLIRVGLIALIVLAGTVMLAVLQRVTATPEPASGPSAKEIVRFKGRDELWARGHVLAILKEDVSNRLRDSVHGRLLLEIGLNERLRATKPPWHVVAHAAEAQLAFESFEAAFAHFRRRVLLLGGPGSGKTTTLYHVAQSLIAEAEADPAAPIPLLFSLSKFSLSALTTGAQGGWPWQVQGASVEQSLPIQLWLVDQAVQRFPFLTEDQVHGWLGGGAAVLLLDGLDEVDERVVLTLVQDLNRYLNSHPDTAAIICSRIVEYQPLERDERTRLALNGAVTLEPLTRAQIDDYLRSANAEALRAAMPSDEALYQLAETPLTLSVMTLAYGGSSVNDLPTGVSLIERRAALFDQYIERMIARTARKQARQGGEGEPIRTLRYPRVERKVRRALGWLALRLSEHAQTSFQPRDLFGLLERNELLALKPPTVLPLQLLLHLLFLCCALAMFWGGSITLRLLGLAVLMQLLVWLVFSLILLISEGFSERAEFRPERSDSRMQRWLAKAGEVAAFVGVVVLFVVLIIGSLGAASAALGSLLPGDPPGYIVALLTVEVITLGFLAQSRVWMLWRLVVSMALAGALLGLLFALLGGGFAALFWNGLTLGATLALVYRLVRNDRFASTNPLTVLGVGGMLWLAAILGQLLVPILMGWHVLMLLTFSVFVVLVIDPDDETTGILRLLGLHLGVMLGALASPLLALLLGSLGVTIVGMVRSIRRFDSRKEAARRAKLDAAIMRFFRHSCLTPAVALLLWLRGIPLSSNRFLSYCRNTLLLKAAGDEQEFIHRLMRDHFAVGAIVPRLHRADPSRQILLIHSLSRQGEAAIDLLQSLAKSPNSQVRAAVMLAFGRIGMPAVVPLLREGFRDRDIAVRQATARSLRKLQTDDAAQLCAIALDDADPSVRAAVAPTVATLAARGQVSTLGNRLLERMVLDPDLTVFGAILFYYSNLEHVGDILGAQRYTSFLDRLRPLLEDTDAGRRQLGVRLLGILGFIETEPDLVRMLEDPDAEVADSALMALAGLGTPEAYRQVRRKLASFADTLVGLRGWSRWLSSHRRLRLRAKAMLDAIMYCGDLSAPPLLEPWLVTPDAELRRRTARVLSAIGNKSAAPALISCLDATAPSLRVAGVEALATLRAEEALPRLQLLLKDSSASVRKATVSAIGRIMGEAGLSLIIPLLGDHSAEVRLEVASTLSSIGGPLAAATLRGALERQLRASNGLLMQCLRSLARVQGELNRWIYKFDGQLVDLGMYLALVSRAEDVQFCVKLFARKLHHLTMWDLQKLERAHSPTAQAILAALIERLPETAWSKFSLPKPRAFAALVEKLLRSPSSQVRYNAAFWLYERGDSGYLAPLREALEAEADSGVRVQILLALYALGDRSAEDELALLLPSGADKRFTGRDIQIAQHLAATGHAGAIEWLLELLVSKQVDRHRVEIFKTLEAVNPPAFQDWLRSPVAEEMMPELLLFAARGRRGDMQALEPLLRAYSAILSAKGYERDEESRLRREQELELVVETLRTMDHGQVQAAIETVFLTGSLAARVAAARLCGEFKLEEQVPALCARLLGDALSVRVEAALALGKIGHIAPVPMLISALEQGETAVLRCAAAEALGLIGDPSALPALQGAVEQQICDVAGQRNLGDVASEALKRIVAGGS